MLHLAAAPEYLACERLVLYSALPGEIPVEAMFSRASRDGKRVLFPRMLSAVEIVLSPVARIEELQPGRYGVPEPGPRAPIEPLGSDVLVLVPGVAFDGVGARLGRGGGAWDRVLRERRGATVFGVGFECQRVDRVPTEPHDQPMDAVLTEAGVRRVTSP